MQTKLKVTKGLFFLFLSFLPTISAQVVEKSDRTKKRETILAGIPRKADQKPADKNSGKEYLNEKPSEDRDRSPERVLSDDKGAMPPTGNFRLRRGEKEYSIDLSGSPFNPSNFSGPKEYDVYGRRVITTSLRFGRVIGTKGPVTFEYLFEVLPLVVFFKNEVKNKAYKARMNETTLVPATRRETTYGVGVQPLGFRFIFLPEKRIRPFAQVGTGVLFTNKAVPVPYSKNINFTGDFGGGVQYFVSRRRAVSFGYRYFHISNANVGGKVNNPGYNANIFYFGYSFFK